MATAYLEKIPLTTLRLMIPTTWDAYQDTCEWAILDSQSNVLRRGKDLFNALPQCDEVEVIISALMIGFIPAQLPPGSQSKILGALAFLVEASLISIPEDTHAVLAEQNAAEVVVAVVQKSWIKILLEKLSQVDIYPVRMYPETLLPELPDQSWAMVCRGSDSFIKTSGVQGFAINLNHSDLNNPDVNNSNIDYTSGTPPLLLTLALQQCEPLNRPSSIVIYGENFSQRDVWQAELGIPIALAAKQEWFVSRTKPALNLLQGEFQPAGGVMRRLSAFKPVAITMLVLLALHLGFTGLDYALKANENRKLDQAMLIQFKSTFPKSNTVVDAPLQMQRNLEELKHSAGQGANSDYLPMLAAVTSSIGAVSAERLRGMDYQYSRLVLKLLLPDMEQAEAMQKRLGASGLFATLETPHKTDQGIELSFVLTANKS